MHQNNILEIKNFKLKNENQGKKFNLQLKRDSIHSILFQNEELKAELIDFLTGKNSLEDAELMIDGEKITQAQLKKLYKDKIYLINRYSAVNPEKDALAIFKFNKKGKGENKSTVFPEMTVAENIFFGREPLKSFLFFKSIDNKKMNEKTLELLKLFELDLDPKQKMVELSPLEKQLVELLKALSRDAEIILIDQAVIELNGEQKKMFFSFMKQLREKGISIIYLTKEIEEVFQTSDYVSILKVGEDKGSYKVSELEYNELALLLMGK